MIGCAVKASSVIISSPQMSGRYWCGEMSTGLQVKAARNPSPEATNKLVLDFLRA